MRCQRVGVSAFAILLELGLRYEALANLGSRNTRLGAFPTCFTRRSDDLAVEARGGHDTQESQLASD